MTHPTPPAAASDFAIERFTEWLAGEMPAGTVIGDPRWWAPKIVRAIDNYRALLAAPPIAQQGGVEETPVQRVIRIARSLPEWDGVTFNEELSQAVRALASKADGGES